jgi:hypothetical protein
VLWSGANANDSTVFEAVRRLRVRYDQSPERFFAFALLACSVICFKALQRPP